MTNIKKCFLGLSGILYLSPCSQADTKMDISPIPEYETCCGMETVEFKPQLPDGSTRYIYIPNSFTPNEDGVNDLFHPVFNDDISHFEYMVITQEVMDDTSSPLVYQVEFITRENIRETAWNGMDSNGKKN